MTNSRRALTALISCRARVKPLWSCHLIRRIYTRIHTHHHTPTASARGQDSAGYNNHVHIHCSAPIIYYFSPHILGVFDAQPVWTRKKKREKKTTSESSTTLVFSRVISRSCSTRAQGTTEYAKMNLAVARLSCDYLFSSEKKKK